MSFILQDKSSSFPFASISPHFLLSVSLVSLLFVVKHCQHVTTVPRPPSGPAQPHIRCCQNACGTQRLFASDISLWTPFIPEQLKMLTSKAAYSYQTPCFHGSQHIRYPATRERESSRTSFHSYVVSTMVEPTSFLRNKFRFIDSPPTTTLSSNHDVSRQLEKQILQSGS